jgi:hypothetical protein
MKLAGLFGLVEDKRQPSTRDFTVSAVPKKPEKNPIARDKPN